LEKGLVEVLKYATKIFTEDDPNKAGKRSQPRQLYIAAIHEINKAMKGVRLFGAFGFKLPPKIEKPEPQQTVIIEPENWVYDLGHADWVNELSASIDGTG
jgi:hypothetical protein